MKELTDRQAQVWRFVAEFSEKNGWPPSIREIAAFFDVGPGAVQAHLDALKKKGYISWSEKQRQSRALKLTRQEDPDDGTEVKIPILGTVAAGRPLLSEENLNGHVPIAPSVLKKNATYFALLVRGESMIGAGILDGDLAVIEQRETAENGQIVVAVVEEERIILKRFFKESARICLKSENPAFRDIFTQNARIAGVLSHIIRRY
jgi:repressor LexA